MPTPPEKSQLILNAASNLLGVSLVIVTGLHITAVSERSIADEVAMAAAALLTASCFLSYQSIRGGPDWYERVADRIFLLAQLLLFAAVAGLWL